MKNVPQEIDIREYAHRLLAWITILSLIPFPPSPARASSIEWASAGSLIEQEALAPPAAGVLRTFDPVRVQWVRMEEEWEPRLAGETPVHRAIREVERLLESGESRQAMILAEVLADDLAIAHYVGSANQLMDTWASWFPSDLPLDVTATNLEQLAMALDRLLAMPAFLAAQTPIDAFFIERIWRARFENPESPRVIQGFESRIDMGEALAHALDLEATLKIRIPPNARKWVENRSAVSVGVFGLRTVGWIMTAMEDLYPPLKTVGWRLRVDGKIQMDARKTISPGQRLSLVLPESA
jgi:hypothetical protein